MNLYYATYSARLDHTIVHTENYAQEDYDQPSRDGGRYDRKLLLVQTHRLVYRTKKCLRQIDSLKLRWRAARWALFEAKRTRVTQHGVPARLGYHVDFAVHADHARVPHV